MVPIPTSTAGSSPFSTVTETDTIKVDTAVTEAIIEVTVAGSSSQELLLARCLRQENKNVHSPLYEGPKGSERCKWLTDQHCTLACH